MSETIRHGLALLVAGQAQKEVTHNEALLAIDRQLHLVVETRGLSSPPISPAVGSSYIVASGADGAWEGRAGALATSDGLGWTFTQPVRGCLAWVADEGVFTVHDAEWSAGGWPASALRIAGRDVMGASPVEIVGPVGGNIVDTEIRVAFLSLIAALREQGVIS
jgi:hypothetical protein